MLFTIASTLVAAGGAVQAAADPAAAVASAKAEELSSPTNAGGGKAHRLLQKMKNRRARVLHAEAEGRGAENDVGILNGADSPRFLQENDYDYYCPRDTCPAELCDCADSGGSLEDCTHELKAVCEAGELHLCVFEDYVQVYQEVYCPFVACTEEGFRESQCDCAFYDLYCARLHSNECSNASTDPDKKPFFGCDETELRNVCDEATACTSRGELQGLPDLGTWKGSVMTGIRSPGEKARGGIAVAGVTLLSMLWLMVNV